MVESGSIEPEYEDLLTTVQVARILNVHRAAVNKWVTKGQITAIRTPGGHIRIRRSDIEDLFKTTEAAS
jgi:excisionase family DNA binding protein